MAVGESYDRQWTARATVSLYSDAWNGHSWSLRMLPLPRGATGAQIASVSCAHHCVAVGSYHRGGHRHALAEIWNGRRWTLADQGLPKPRRAPSLTSVACVRHRGCVAVGSIRVRRHRYRRPLAARWRGGHWSAQRTPAPPMVAKHRSAGFIAVSCPTAGFCQAVGSSFVERYG